MFFSDIFAEKQDKHMEEIQENKKLLLKKFSQLLKANNAYGNYLLNLLKHRHNISFFIKRTHDESYWLSSAFAWYCTDQGEMYWNSLNREWRKILSNLSKKYYG